MCRGPPICSRLHRPCHGVTCGRVTYVVARGYPRHPRENLVENLTPRWYATSPFRPESMVTSTNDYQARAPCHPGKILSASDGSGLREPAGNLCGRPLSTNPTYSHWRGSHTAGPGRTNARPSARPPVRPQRGHAAAARRPDNTDHAPPGARRRSRRTSAARGEAWSRRPNSIRTPKQQEKHSEKSTNEQRAPKQDNTGQQVSNYRRRPAGTGRLVPDG